MTFYIFINQWSLSHSRAARLYSKKLEGMAQQTQKLYGKQVRVVESYSSAISESVLSLSATRVALKS